MNAKTEFIVYPYTEVLVLAYPGNDYSGYSDGGIWNIFTGGGLCSGGINFEP